MVLSLNRRLAGAVALIAALLVALIIPRALEPDAAGIASAERLPDPPQIGDCVTISGEIKTVQCEQAHDGEVAWAASSRSADKSLAGSYESQWALAADPVAAADSACANWALGYVGTGIAEPANRLESWLPLPPYWVSALVRGPSTDFPERLGWFACVVSPSNGESYIGSVRGDGAELRNSRPGAFATCLALGENAIHTLEFTSCGQPHRIEFMATLVVTQKMADTGRVDAEVSSDLLYQQCVDAVVRMTGNPDATYGGRLAISVEAVSQRGISVSEPAPDVAAGQLILPDCLVELVGDGNLVQSVIGLGDVPLPVQ